MLTTETALPTPSPLEQAHSAELRAKIQAELKRDGSMPFERFMQQALYAEGLGYYQSGTVKIGAEGDFTTAPEMTPLFGASWAHQARAVFEIMGAADVLELGAGSGALAAGALTELSDWGGTYYILEPSPVLQAKQREGLASWGNKVQWLTRLPEAFRGVIWANEVVDALPVALVSKTQDGWQEHTVTLDGDDFAWGRQAARSEVLASLAALDVPIGYTSEVNVWLKPWLHSLADCLELGVVLLCDYGFPRYEYYHPQRSTGTLMCHYRHHAHPDPLWWPGLQDITAHVDFTALAEAGRSGGLQLAGYSNQAAFLLNCGLLNDLERYAGDQAEYFHQCQQVKRLTSPAEMGELFKCMAFSKGFDAPLLGFYHHDKRGRL